MAECGDSSEPGPSAPLVAKPDQRAIQAGRSHCVYTRMASCSLPGLESLGYALGKTLGSGTYAKVKATWSARHDKMVAMKILNKKVASKEYLTKFLPREMRILQMVRHPHIAEVYEIIETERHTYFIMELACNGDLLDYINSRHYIPEPEARYMCNQLLEAMEYCHSLNIAHRDLKCENILLGPNLDIKLGDFGFALDLSLDAAKTPCGSYSYAAPELFTSKGASYDGKKADIWSMGVILYAMVCGRLPFGDDNQIKKTQARVLYFNRNISSDSRLLLHQMLNINVSERIDMLAIKHHPWMAATMIKPQMLNNGPKYTRENSIPAQRVSDKQQKMPLPQPFQLGTTATICGKRVAEPDNIPGESSKKQGISESATT